MIEAKAAKIKECIGVMLDMTNFESLKAIKADYHADVRIVIDGVIKDFSISEFKQKLGFE